jgi:hypothetical protein
MNIRTYSNYSTLIPNRLPRFPARDRGEIVASFSLSLSQKKESYFEEKKDGRVQDKLVEAQRCARET